MSSKRVPSLSRHKASGQGVARIGGQDFYFGPWPEDRRDPPPDVQSRYDAAIAEWLSSGRVHTAQSKEEPLTIAQVIDEYWRHVEQYYRKPDGAPSGEQNEYRLSLRPLRHLYATLPAAQFGAPHLEAVRHLMVTGYHHPKYGPQRKLSRNVINQRIGRIVRAFKWAVRRKRVPAAVHHELVTVGGLKSGRSDALETEPVTPVALAHVEATVPFLLPTVAAMVRVQLLTGARPGEVCLMRACDIDMRGNVWLYRPDQHKTKHKGKDRVIAVGPQAQAIIRPFLKTTLEAFLFSPRDAVEAKIAARALKRKTALSCGNRPGTNRKKNPKRKPGERYNTRSYYHAITRAAEKADAKARLEAIKEADAAGRASPSPETVFVPHWHPHQLRHTHATEVRRRFGLEAVQVALGHSHASISEIYAERDLSLALRVAGEMG